MKLFTTFNHLAKMGALVLALALTACSQSGDDKAPAGPTGTGPGGEPIVISLSGGLVVKQASSAPIEITSPQIFNELDQQVRDGYEFTLTGEDGVVVGALNADINSFTTTTVVTSFSGKIKFQAKVPTTMGSYKVSVKPKNSVAIGRFFISVDPGPVAVLGEIKGTRYEDRPAFNGIKDSDENWVVLGDGTSTTYVNVGPVLDAYGNKVNRARIRLSVSDGALLSENPVSISDGLGFFTLESMNGTGLIAIQADALDDNNNVISTIFGNIEAVRPVLEISEDGNMGTVFVNQTLIKTFTVRNTGSTSVTNLFTDVDAPFIKKSTGSCTGVTRLRPTESCTLHIEFTAGIRQLFQGNLLVKGNPTSVSGSTLVKPIQAQAVTPAEIRISNSNLDYGTKTCGVTYDEELVVSNIGDLPGLNFHVTSPPAHPGQTVPFVTFIVNPADVNPNPDPDVVINCGNVIPPGRKCRVIARFHPQALVTASPITGSVAIDGQAPIGVVVRAASQPGAPVGTIPVTIITPSEAQSGTNTTNDTMLISEDYTSSVVVGPLKDGCGITVANGYSINALVTAGSLINDTAITNNGSATFAWKGSNDVSKIGPQSVSVTSGVATGAKGLTFQGVRLEMTGPTDLGQVLTGRNKSFDYTLSNTGNLPLNNLTFATSPANLSWGGLDFSYAGGCEDFKLLAGETCILRFRVSPTTTGTVSTVITAESIQDMGQNHQTISIAGLAQNPPVVRFGNSGSYNLGNFVAGTPITGNLELINVGPATANSLVYNLASPFVITNNPCGTSMLGATTCNISVSLAATTAGNYQSQISVTSESPTALANVFATITPAKASGTIPMVFSVPSVPANASSTINVTIGPIKDAYGNIVVAGTPVLVETTAGRMNVDTDLNGQEVLNTNSSGLITLNIRSSSTSEITSFTMTSKIFDTDGTTVLAQGSQGGSFTGARLDFVTAAVNFGSVALGRLEIRTVTLRNFGNETASNVTISSGSSDFPVSGQTACATLAPNAQCTFNVTFFPAQAGARSTNISANATGNGILSDTVAVSGTGVLPADIVVSPASITVNILPGGSATGSFTITNSGAEALDSLAIASDTRNSEFNFGNISSCQTLGQDQFCTVNFTFTPTAPVNGDVFATVTATGQSPSRATVSTTTVRVRPSFIVFSQRPTVLNLNECGSFRLQAQDADQNLLNVASTISMNLSMSGGTGGFYTSSNCTTGNISTISINSGSSQSNVFYFKGANNADYTVTASNSLFSVQAIVKVFAPLSFTVTNAKVPVGGSYTFVASGGIAPYEYTVRTAGGGTIGATTGIYVAPITVGTYVIRATDNLGNTVETNAITYIPQIFVGGGYMCNENDGDLTCSGAKNFGQYDNSASVAGTYLEKVPVPNKTVYTPALGKVSFMSAGQNHACFIRSSDNRIFCQGLNHYGQLGDNSRVDKNTGSLISSLVAGSNSANSLSVGFGDHSCALNASGQVYCWGNNDFQQINGTASPTFSLTPALITSAGTGNKKVALGKNATCVITSSDSVRCWGALPLTQVASFNSIYAPVALGGDLANIQDLSAGIAHACAVDSTNRLFCWGDNTYGQLGNGNNTASTATFQTATGVKRVFAGGYHTCAIKTDDSLVCWGRNHRGQLGLGNTTDRNTPQAVFGATPIYAMSLGRDTSCVVNSAGSVRCFGDNSFGAMVSNTAFVSSPTLVGSAISSCNAGLTYNSGDKSCKCTTSSQIFTFELQNCSSAPVFTAGSTPPAIQAFSIPGTVHNISLDVTTSSQALTDIPVHFVQVGVGNGTFPAGKGITGSYTSSSSTNMTGKVTTTLTKGSSGDDSLEYRIGNSATAKASTTYPLTPASCQGYIAYGYTSANNSGDKQIYYGGSGYTVRCRFSGSNGFTYYNNTMGHALGYIRQNVTLDMGTSLTVPACPFNTQIVWNTGKLAWNCQNTEMTGAIVEQSCNFAKPAQVNTSSGGTFSVSDIQGVCGGTYAPFTCPAGQARTPWADMEYLEAQYNCQ